jgi:hypothetical protein
MLLGLVMLTASWGLTENGWVVFYVWSLFLYGIGVGGEYPMTATTGMENAMGSGTVSNKEDRLHRGRRVTGAFLMQGWGQLFNQVVLILLLLCFDHGSGNPPYSNWTAQWTYRVSFAIPAIGTLWLVYYRAFKMRSASKQLVAAKMKSQVTGYDTESLKLTFTHFGPRMIATAGAWFANDVFFYGNKLFQGEFIKVITTEDSSIMPGWLYSLVNVTVSLVGYYLACKRPRSGVDLMILTVPAILIDHKLYGRKKMQMVGFLMDFILFIIPAFNYDYFTREEHIVGFQAMYFLSSFFNQFGPNAVTFLVAAEVYPTPIRATAHGFSAACGKFGALTAAVMYNYISTQQKFYVVPWFGLAGMLVTWLFLPDTTGLDLKEQERRWNFIRTGRESEYHGVAVHPQHLSLYERWTGVGKHYNPDLDFVAHVAELRGDWEASRRGLSAESVHHGDDVIEGNIWSSAVSTYFESTSRKILTPEDEKDMRDGFGG